MSYIQVLSKHYRLQLVFANILHEGANLPGSSTRHTEATVTQTRSDRIAHKPRVGIRVTVLPGIQRPQ